MSQNTRENLFAFDFGLKEISGLSVTKNYGVTSKENDTTRTSFMKGAGKGNASNLHSTVLGTGTTLMLPVWLFAATGNNTT